MKTMKTCAVDREEQSSSTAPVRDEVDLQRRRLLGVLGLAPLVVGMVACGGGSGDPADPPTATRIWKMGFFPTPPRLDVSAVLQGVDLFSKRAELVLIHEELPWTDLLGGMSPDAILDRDKVELVRYVRSKGLRLAFMADLTDGLSRGEEAPQLRQLGRSIAEPAVQQAYRGYVLAVARKLEPDFIGLAAETNLIRIAAPASLYAAVVQAANGAAADLSAAGIAAPRLVSVQVEAAWGVLVGAGEYVGIDGDVRDFPFTEMLGLSSYPYFGFDRPEDLPIDYYSRLFGGRTLPGIVVEGGWASASVGAVSSSPDEQARYIERQGRLLDSIDARGVIQTLFADLDVASLPPPVPANLPLFASLGLTDSEFVAKPALAAWDALFARRLIS